MTLSEQKYEVLQILAEGEHKGWPLAMTIVAMLGFFDRHRIDPPNCIVEWLTTGEGSHTFH